ncbi:MAG: glutathione synthase, partial [Candidatus Binatota bacterium]|nr:glutathione synthase [Candidatus Binatota bacterium]
MSKLRIGVVMDPVENISIDKDTTFVLMLEAQRRG